MGRTSKFCCWWPSCSSERAAPFRLAHSHHFHRLRKYSILAFSGLPHSWIHKFPDCLSHPNLGYAIVTHFRYGGDTNLHAEVYSSRTHPFFGEAGSGGLYTILSPTHPIFSNYSQRWLITITIHRSIPNATCQVRRQSIAGVLLAIFPCVTISDRDTNHPFTPAPLFLLFLPWSAVNKMLSLHIRFVCLLVRCRWPSLRKKRRKRTTQTIYYYSIGLEDEAKLDGAVWCINRWEWPATEASTSNLWRP